MAWLAVGTVAPMSSCRCASEDGADAGADAAVDGGGAGAGKVMSEHASELPNGLRLELVAGPCGDAVGVAVVLAVGVAHDPAGRSGMAHLTERVLASLVKPGPSPHAVESGERYTLCSAAVTTEGVLGELDRVAAWLAHVPTEAELEREKKSVLAELEERDGADAKSAARSIAEESLFPTQSDGKRRGIAEQVEAITLEELERWWREHIKAGNARVVVTGAFDVDAVRAHAEKVLGPLARGTPPKAGEPVQATVKGTLVMGDAPTAVAIAVPAPELASPALPSFLVLAARLLAEPTATRSWAVDYDPVRRPELLLVTGAVGPGEQPEPAANRIRGEVEKVVAAPLGEEETERARERFRLFLDPALLEASTCADDPRAFAIARALRGLRDAAPASLDGAADKLDEARARFGPKGSAAVIAGGVIR